ncbi:adenylosuccinate synthetase [Candidatus Saccharibacteria bacterium]|nr:adenylosuccinate synthetase [Candidatus Saccharibacteria bacterium]
MLEQIYVVTDLGPGDGGKGGIVHTLAHNHSASVVIKRGGAQGSHGIRTSYGEKFNFSQWGCGTLDGIPTFLSEQMVISPVGLENEADALKHLGIYDPFVLLSCDPSCICATPFHRISSQLEELLLGNNPRGTIGTGVGQAYRMHNTLGEEYTILASELTNREIVRTKLQRQLDYYKERYAKVTPSDGLPNDTGLIAENLDLLFDDGFIAYILDLFENIGKKLHLESLDKIIRDHNGTAIVECSHGVLTDAATGLKPHVSAIRTLPKFTSEMLRASGYDSRIINYAVHRAYEIRHGAGPMPTYDADFTARMLPGSHKDTNRWQGAVRAGALDINLLRYALSTSHETTFNGLCLTWFDQILACDRIWPLCVSYENAPVANESYTEFLNRARPITVDFSIKKPIKKQDLFEFVGVILEGLLDVPLKMLSIGPTETDKICSNK